MTRKLRYKKMKMMGSKKMDRKSLRHQIVKMIKKAQASCSLEALGSKIFVYPTFNKTNVLDFCL